MRRRDFIGSALAFAAVLPRRGWAAIAGNLGDLPAKSLSGADIVLGRTDVQALAGSLRGDVLLPGAADYDVARRIWNGMFDKRPALIVQCTGASDVIAAVNFAREHQLLTAVKAGGHNFGGRSTCDGGLMIDLTPLRGVRVDPAARRAYVEGGSLLGQLDRESQVFGLATTAGVISHTGAAGLTLGGGFGRLGRRFGLSCDNVASYDLITADGRFLRVSDTENKDLYWGLRGGGGNFGVVTAFEYRLHPVGPTVLAGEIAWPIDQARDVLRFYRDRAMEAPDTLNLNASLGAGPDGKGSVSIEACWSGDLKLGEQALAPLKQFGKPTSDTIAAIKYADLQSSADAQVPHGLNYYAKNGFLTGLDDAGIDRIIDVGRASAGQFGISIDHGGGAYARVAPEATAFPNRKGRFWLGLIGGWKDPALSHDRVASMRKAWAQLEPLTQGFYTNMADSETPAAANRANYGANFERLVALKGKYDPMNLFRLNANVPPRL